ncbi:NAD(P)H-binding protein [Siminovitchia fortis]|uniref:NAD(P)H-binding protein n=1 Tax=Siminovitchia fortis TaxID=254758 RepID=UPI0011A2AD38|nr:NAD(P)H-binding protein [Siminovitchia fortis]
MNVLIAGACDDTGRCLVDYLAKNTDHETYAVVHEEEQKQTLEYIGQDRISTMPSDVEELNALTEEMDAVIYAGGCDVKTNDQKVIKSVLEDTKALINAAARNKVKRFILLSAMGADDPQGSKEDYLYKKREAEDYLKNTGMDFTIIRAGELSTEKPSGKVKLEESINWIKDPAVSCEDAAKVIAASLDSDRMTNKTVELISGDTSVEDALQKM